MIAGQCPALEVRTGKPVSFPMGLPSQAELEGIRPEPGALADGAREMRQREMGRGDAPWGLRPEMGGRDGS